MPKVCDEVGEIHPEAEIGAGGVAAAPLDAFRLKGLLALQRDAEGCLELQCRRQRGQVSKPTWSW